MGKQKNHIPDASKAEKHPDTFSFMLRMGHWKDDFTVDERKILLAEALNTCSCQRAHHHRMHITGYLVTGKRLFLIMSAHEEYVESIMDFFYKTVRERIRRKHSRHHAHNNAIDFFEVEKHEREKPGHLFEKLVMPPNNLVQLLTGHNVVLPYYDPDLARLKAYLHHENFCSVPDHLGAKGPVVVKTNNT